MTEKWSGKKTAGGVIAFVIVTTVITLIVQDAYKFIRNKSYLKIAEISRRLNDKTAILNVRPLAFIPYIPKPPQVEGQKKALIVVAVEIKNKRLAKNIRVKFYIDDGAGRQIDSVAWDVIAKQEGLIFSMFYPETKIVTWSPDIPNGIKEITDNREKPFKLVLTLTWEDIDNKEHKIENYSELRYNNNSKLFYLEERQNKWLN